MFDDAGWWFQGCYFIEVLFFVYRFEAEGGGRKAEGHI